MSKMSTGEKIALASVIITLAGFITYILYPIIYLQPTPPVMPSPKSPSTPSVVISVEDTPTGFKVIRLELRGEDILKRTITIEEGKKKTTFDMFLASPTPTITKTPEPTPLPIPTEIPIPSPTPTITETPEPIPSPILTETPKPTEGQLPTIDWGIMTTYFDISDITLGENEYTDVLGRVYEYDSINFIVEAKSSFYAIIIFEAEFYDEDGIKVYSSFVDFDPDYDQWQLGDTSKGHVELLSTSDMEKVRHIKISQFI